MKYFRVLIILIIITIVGILAGGAAYSWWLGQTIYINTFNAKAGVGFWQTWTLENNVDTFDITLLHFSSLSNRFPHEKVRHPLRSSMEITSGSRILLLLCINWRLFDHWTECSILDDADG